MYNQLLQFCVLVAGLMPVVLVGLKRAGGWSGLKAAVPAGFLHGGAHTGAHSMGIGVVGLVLGAGIVLGGGTWCADFRLLQTAMAAKNVASARRAPLVAAAVRIFVPLLFILPGLLALGLPTPRTTIVIHDENGAIYHEITVVPPAVEAGQGLVPAKADAAGQPVKGADGQPVLDYAIAMPNMLLQFLPSGLLGLGSSRAARLPDERRRGQPDSIEHGLRLRHLPGVPEERRKRQANFESGTLGGVRRHGCWPLPRPARPCA